MSDESENSSIKQQSTVLPVLFFSLYIAHPKQTKKTIPSIDLHQRETLKTKQYLKKNSQVQHYPSSAMPAIDNLFNFWPCSISVQTDGRLSVATNRTQSLPGSDCGMINGSSLDVARATATGKRREKKTKDTPLAKGVNEVLEGLWE